jgi:hypothetical protein
VKKILKSLLHVAKISMCVFVFLNIIANQFLKFWILVCWLCVMSTTLVHHGYRMWFCHCWECWSSWWTISMWKCGPQHFIFKHGKCALINYNFVEKWNIATCSYINSSCILETTPSTFHLLGVFCCEWRFTCGFWKSLNVAMSVVVVYCDKYFFVPKFCFE